MRRNISATEPVVATLLLLMFAPLIILLLILSWITVRENPVFCQQRVGKDRQLFTIYKVKTMDAVGTTNRFTLLLRRLRFDELLQLVNIIDGSMQFFGYRPMLSADIQQSGVREHQLNYMFQSKPGLLGPNHVRSSEQLKHIYRDYRRLLVRQKCRWFTPLMLWETVEFIRSVGTDRHLIKETPRISG